MAAIEQMTVILTSEMAAIVKDAVQEGEFASHSEVVREALREWKMRRAVQRQEVTELKADIDTGLLDIAEGRVRDFDADRIAERGRALLARVLPSA